MASLDVLNAQLDELQALLPKMIEDNPDPGDFWSQFAGQADAIEDAAGEHSQYVQGRVSAMLGRRVIALASIATPAQPVSLRAASRACTSTAVPCAPACA